MLLNVLLTCLTGGGIVQAAIEVKEKAVDSKTENEVEEKPQPQPDSLSTDSGISMDSGVSSGNSETEIDQELFYEKPKHLNQ